MKVAASAIAGLMFAVGASAQITQSLPINRDNRTITVTATDTASAMADEAVVHIGYQVYGEDEQAAYAEGSKRSNAIAAALKAMNVPEDAIESQDQELQPLNEFELKNLAPALTGMRFRITQSWTVRTSPEEAARVLDAAVKAGANQSGRIEWQMKDPSTLEAAASAKALAHAQAIAGRMAEALHIKLGALLYASNQTPQAIVRPLPMMALAQRASTDQVKPLAVFGRRVQQSATIYAVFSIE